MLPRLFLFLLALALFLSIPSLLRIPRILPLLQEDVRKAAPHALAELRAKGLWLVNVDLRSIQRTQEEVCFVWEHRYTSRAAVAQPEILTTCIHAPKT